MNSQKISLAEIKKKQLVNHITHSISLNRIKKVTVQNADKERLET